MKIQILILVFTSLILSLNAHQREDEDFKTKKKVVLKNRDNIDIVCAPKFCPNSVLKSKEVTDFCKKNNYSIDRRCCLNNDTITGLDYTNCNLKKLTATLDTFASGNFSNVSIFDVRENPKLTECDHEAYVGFVNLDTLYFPSQCDCPGGNFSWTKIAKESCMVQLPYCKSNATYTNCTTNSECIENGPGNFLCNCKENFHGYKCLEEGKFPKLLFTLLVCGGTLFLCAFLWFNQRRLIIKKED